MDSTNTAYYIKFLKSRDEYCQLHPEEEAWITICFWYIIEEGELIF